MFIRIIIAIMDYSVKRLKVANWLSFVCAKLFRLSYRFPLVPGWLGCERIRGVHPDYPLKPVK